MPKAIDRSLTYNTNLLHCVAFYHGCCSLIGYAILTIYSVVDSE